MARVSIRGLSKSYGLANCLKKVDLEIGDGQLAVIVGPSGCGKTTLLRCIAGLEGFSEGKIYIDDELINDKQPKDRDVAMVFQYYALYPHMTVLQNMSIGLQHTTALSKDEVRKRVEGIAKTLQISKLLRRKPAELSGGESQRVAIGRALVRNPKVFLLDEPLTAIDTMLRRELRTEIKRIQRQFNVTTLYITHDQEEAMAVGDLLVVVGDGMIHQVGSPDEVYNHPKDLFVASFIGKPKMNLLKVELEEREGRYFLRNPSLRYEITEDYFRRFLAGSAEKSFIAGIRPHCIKPVFQKAHVPASKMISGRVSLIENMGKDKYLYIDVASERLVAKLSSADVTGIGDELTFTLDETDLQVFAADTGLSQVA